MQGLILAAGRGSRLGRAAWGVPKCLLELGRRRLIDYQLEMCSEAGVAPVGVVVGYGADDVREAVGIRAEYIYNPRWDTTNSLYSFSLARSWVTGPLVIMNCDVLYQPGVLARLLADKGDALVYDSSSGHAPEHMKVVVDGGRLVDIGKELPPERSSGENVGVLQFTAQGAKELFAKAEALLAAGHSRDWLGTAVRELAREREIHAIDIAGLPWAEIDSAYDLSHARKRVLPEIHRRPASSAWRRYARWAAIAAFVTACFAGVAYTVARPHEETPPAEWDTVDIEGSKGFTLPVGDRTQRWWLIEDRQEAHAQVTGPGPVRIETRLLLAGARKLGEPYVLRVTLDDDVVDLYRRNGRPDPATQHPEWTIAQRKRLTIDVPPGPHRLGVQLIPAHDSARCLLRLRVPEVEPESEPGIDAE